MVSAAYGTIWMEPRLPRKHAILPGTADYDRLRESWRDYRSPSMEFLRLNLACDSDPDEYALVLWWGRRWYVHFANWLSEPRPAAGEYPPRSAALCYATDKVNGFIRDEQLPKWVREATGLFMDLALRKIPAVMDMAIDFYRPNPQKPGELISESDLWRQEFPERGDNPNEPNPKYEEGNRKLYDRMRKVRDLFMDGPWEFDGAETTTAQMQRRKGSR